MTFGGALDGTSSAFLSQVKGAHGYLATTQPHAYIPFSLFAIIHAVRVACVYRGIARAGGYDDKLGSLQAALVPLILILGGSTISNILLGVVPGWVISPIPVATYGLLPLLAYKTGLTSALLNLPALPREVLFACVDGFSRTFGITTLGVDAVLSHPNTALRASPWAMIVIATLSGGGGGMIVPAIKGFGPNWGFTDTPSWVKDGPAIDIWGATVIGYVYATLVDAHPFFRLLPNALFGNSPLLRSVFHLPKNYLTAAGSRPLLPIDEAKTFCSLLLATMLVIRVLRPVLTAPFGSSKSRRAIKPKPSSVNGKKLSTAVAPVLKEKKNQ